MQSAIPFFLPRARVYVYVLGKCGSVRVYIVARVFFIVDWRRRGFMRSACERVRCVCARVEKKVAIEIERYKEEGGRGGV